MIPADEALVDLVVEEPGWEKALPDLHSVATRAVEAVLRSAGLRTDDFALVLLACDDARIAGLNAEFRGRAAPTNVLSWPAFELGAAASGLAPARPQPGHGGRRTSLGDVAIALQTVVREAETGRLPLKNHVLHLIVHGCLHLLGYDHERPDDANLMEGLERRLLAGEGIPDPYR